jgi:hypothetical protein
LKTQERTWVRFPNEPNSQPQEPTFFADRSGNSGLATRHSGSQPIGCGCNQEHRYREPKTQEESRYAHENSGRVLRW